MQIDWEAWYYAPGSPPVTHEYDTSLAEQAYALATKWHTADVMGIGELVVATVVCELTRLLQSS